MALTQDDLLRILQNGRESLNSEFKPWFPPLEDFGKSIIAKACMALRNADGGFLIVGMNDDGFPDNRDHIADVRTAFHHDIVQEIVARFSSEPFEITVHFVEFEGMERVVIEVPTGLRTPIVCRNSLPRLATPGGHAVGSLLQEGVVYVRTLAANGRPSSSIAKPVDWPRVMETCFNNREADIGSFLRRQLSGLDISATSSALFEILRIAKSPTPTETADAFLDNCYARYQKRKEQLVPQPPTTALREISAIIAGEFDHPALSADYLFQLGQVPRFSGWPPFVSLMNADSEYAVVHYDEEGVESLEYVKGRFHSLDFSRIEGSGRFYYLEGVRDDFVDEIEPLQRLEYVTEARRVTEVVALILLFAKRFCGSDSANQISFAFRWTGLANRQLWLRSAQTLVSRRPATKDDIVTHATIPVSVPPNAIGLHVEHVLKPVFRLFGGWEFESGVIQDIVTDTLHRRL